MYHLNTCQYILCETFSVPIIWNFHILAWYMIVWCIWISHSKSNLQYHNIQSNCKLQINNNNFALLILRIPFGIAKYCKALYDNHKWILSNTIKLIVLTNLLPAISKSSEQFECIILTRYKSYFCSKLATASQVNVPSRPTSCHRTCGRVLLIVQLTSNIL